MATTTHPENLSILADKWPSAIVAREEIGTFSGGTLTPKYMANLDSKGEGPSKAIRIGKKVAYLVTDVVEWMEKRSTRRKSEV